MSGANYMYCLVCDSKAVYVGEDDWPDGVAVIHVKCHEDATAAAVAAEMARLVTLAGELRAVYSVRRMSADDPPQPYFAEEWFADAIRRQP
jgi:hypothetical protein